MEKDYTENKFLFLDYLTKICYANIPFKILIDLSIRSHYIIDEITALVLAHYCILSSDEISNLFDEYIPLDYDLFHDEENSTNMIELNLLSETPGNTDVEIHVVEDKYF
jgi:hypothetical protein